MVNSKGVLCFRTLAKNGSVRRAPIPFNPGLPAGLVSWGSSPHASKEGEWLIATQMNWTAPYENAETADVPFPTLDAIPRGVLEQFPNDTWVHRDRLLVRGMLGHFYEIRSEGEHNNAPFKIHGVGKRGRNVTPFAFTPVNITETYRLAIPLQSSFSSRTLLLENESTVSKCI